LPRQRAERYKRPSPGARGLSVKRATDLIACARVKRATNLTAIKASGGIAVCSRSEHQVNRPQAGLAGEGCAFWAFSHLCGVESRQNREQGCTNDHRPAHASDGRYRPSRYRGEWQTCRVLAGTRRRGGGRFHRPHAGLADGGCSLSASRTFSSLTRVQRATASDPPFLTRATDLAVSEASDPSSLTRAKRATDLTGNEAGGPPYLARAKRATDLAANEARGPPSLTRAKRAT